MMNFETNELESVAECVPAFRNIINEAERGDKEECMLAFSVPAFTSIDEKTKEERKFRPAFIVPAFNTIENQGNDKPEAMLDEKEQSVCLTRMPECTITEAETMEVIANNKNHNSNIITSLPEVKMQKNILPKSNFSLRLISEKQIINETVDGNVIMYKYCFCVSCNGIIQNIEVEAEKIEQTSWVKKATKGRAMIVDTKLFKKYVHKVLEEDYANIPIECYYEKNGWKELPDGRILYLCDHGIVGNPTKMFRASTNLKFKIEKEKVGKLENFEEFYGMEKIVNNKDISRTLMVFTSLSVMTTLFEKAGFPVKFLLCMLGTTNSLKTSTALVFSKIFNANTSNNNPEVTFSSTKSGIETMVSQYADSILLVDDFMPADSRAKQYEQNEKLELLCRLYGDRTPKKRMTDFAGKKVEYPVKGCCLITGELLAGVESSKTRMVILNLQKDGVDKDMLAYYQQQPLILPTYLYGYINFLEKNVHACIDRLKTSVTQYRRSSNYVIARLNETQAILFAVIDEMVSYWKNSSFIACDSTVQEVWKKSIQSIMQENAGKLLSESLAEMILKALEEEVCLNPNAVKNIQDITLEGIDLIYEDEEFYYIRNECLYMLTKNYCKKYGIDYYFNQNMLIPKLKERGILDTIVNEKGNEEGARKLMQGKKIRKRFLFIKKKVFYQILNQTY